MVQCGRQSFKSIFLKISTTCGVWFQEGGGGFGTDLVHSAVSRIPAIPSFLLRQNGQREK